MTKRSLRGANWTLLESLILVELAMKYSDRLGEISDEQLQKALDRFCLGKLVKAESISEGLFGQNLFLISSKGEFVFRGAPHYSWQFKNEKLFADLLHKHTSAPVPWPYLVDESKDIFGWSYCLMPRLKGKKITDSNLDDYDDQDLKEIAQTQGELLAEAQNLTWDFCGKYSAEIDDIQQFEDNLFTWFKKDTLKWLRTAKSYNNKTTKKDLDWVENQYQEAEPWLDNDFKPCFVMQDYKLENMLVDKLDGRWEVTGLFDLMESYFGHGEADLSRLFAQYVGLDRVDLANIFVKSYVRAKEVGDGLEKRFPIFMIHDKAIIWEWAQRKDRGWWDKSFTFREYVEGFLCLDLS